MSMPHIFIYCIDNFLSVCSRQFKIFKHANLAYAQTAYFFQVIAYIMCFMRWAASLCNFLHEAHMVGKTAVLYKCVWVYITLIEFTCIRLHCKIKNWSLAFLISSIASQIYLPDWFIDPCNNYWYLWLSQLLDDPQFRCITKIKTIGSTYMAASGVTPDVNSNGYNTVKVSSERKTEELQLWKYPWSHDHILGAWQLGHIYDWLQCPPICNSLPPSFYFFCCFPAKLDIWENVFA